MNNKLEAGMGQGRDMKNKLEAGLGQGRDNRANFRQYPGKIPVRRDPGGKACTLQVHNCVSVLELL